MQIDLAQLRPADTLVSIAEACALARVSRRTIYHWIALGKVDYVRTAGGSVRIVQSTLFQSKGYAARG